MKSTASIGTSRALTAAVALCAIGSAAQANILTDPGFEVNPLDDIITVLNDFTTYQGVWGTEVGLITGVDGGIVPFQGSLMLRMDDDGGVTTQTLQMVDVSSYAALIDSGLAVVEASAWFNAAPGFLGGQGGVGVGYYSAANFGSNIGGSANFYVSMDGDAQSWQQSSLSESIPVGTRWMYFQVVFDNSTMFGFPGYVDAAEMRIVPTPGAAAMLGMAGIAAFRRRRV